MPDTNALIPRANYEIIRDSGVSSILTQIRPAWQSKNLIERVGRLLQVDPSSACQRIFNAAVHDLREKIVVAGLDIAAEAAKSNRLPQITKPEDVENISVSHVIALAYRMGLLSRPEWRRILRVYDIRRDLEHEDDEYEAGVEDCVYVFKTCVDVVLSKDPVHLLKLTDVKEVVEKPSAAFLSATLIEDYRLAPSPRQLEIYRFLFSNCLNDELADVVRENSFHALSTLRDDTEKQVILETASDLVQRLNRKPPSLTIARVAHAAGILPYLKKSMLRDFFGAFLNRMRQVGHTFRSNESHGELLRNLSEVGGLRVCPQEVLTAMAEWLVLCYVGEEGGYGYWGQNRTVFYSNVGAPLARELLLQAAPRIVDIIRGLRESSKELRRECTNEHVAARYEALVEQVEEFEN